MLNLDNPSGCQHVGRRCKKLSLWKRILRRLM